MGALILVTTFVGCTRAIDQKHWEMAEDFKRQGQQLRAIEEYSRVVNYGRRSPLAIQAQFEIAKLYEGTIKDYPRAIRAYRDVMIRSDDKQIQIAARTAIAKVLTDRLNDLSAAAQEYSQLFEDVQNKKEGPGVLLSWAKVLMDLGRFREAGVLFGSFRGRYPGHKEGPRSILDQGLAYLADRDSDKAKESFRELISTFSGQDGFASLVAEAYYGLGNALEQGNDFKGALEAYKAAAQTYPNPKVIERKIRGVEERQKQKIK